MSVRGGGVEEEEEEGEEEGEEEFEDYEEDDGDGDEEEWWQKQQRQQRRSSRRRPVPAFGPLYSNAAPPPPSPSEQGGVADASSDPAWYDSRQRLAFGGAAPVVPSSTSTSSSSFHPQRPRLETMRGLPLDAQERGVVEGLLTAFAGGLDDGDFVRPVASFDPPPPSSAAALPSASPAFASAPAPPPPSSSPSSSLPLLDEFGNPAARFELCPGADPGVSELASRLLPLASAASDVARLAHVSRRRRVGLVAAGAGSEAVRVLCEWRRHVARVEHASLSTGCGRGGGVSVRGRRSSNSSNDGRAGMGLQQLSLAFSSDCPAVASLIETAAAAREAAALSATGGALLDLLARRSAAARGDPPRAAAAGSLLSAAAAPYFAALHSWVTRGELAGGSGSSSSSRKGNSGGDDGGERGASDDDDDEDDDDLPSSLSPFSSSNELPILEDPSVLPGDVAPDGSDAFWTRKYTLKLKKDASVDAPACLGARAAEDALAAGRAVAALRVILSSSSSSSSSGSSSASSPAAALLSDFCPLPAGTRVEYDGAGVFRRTLAAAARRASAALLEVMMTATAKANREKTAPPLLPLSLPTALSTARRYLLFERGDVALALADVAAEGLWSENGLGGSGANESSNSDPGCFLPLSSVPASALAARGPRARGALLERALSACGCAGDAAALPLRLKLDGRSLLNMLRDLREEETRKPNSSAAAVLEESRGKEKKASARLLLRSRSAAEALSLSLRAPWPLSIVVPKSAADAYAALARHVSDLGCAEARLAGAWLALAKPLRRVSQSSSSSAAAASSASASGRGRGRGGRSTSRSSSSSAPSPLLSRILFQRSCVASALRALHAHAVEDVLSPALRQLRSDLRGSWNDSSSSSSSSSASSHMAVEEAARAHARFLDAATRGVLLSRRAKLFRAVGEIKAAASVLAGAVEALVAEAAVFGGGGVGESMEEEDEVAVPPTSPLSRHRVRRRSSFGVPPSAAATPSSSSSRRASVGGLAIDAPLLSPATALLDGAPSAAANAVSGGGGDDAADGGAAARAARASASAAALESAAAAAAGPCSSSSAVSQSVDGASARLRAALIDLVSGVEEALRVGGGGSTGSGENGNDTGGGGELDALARLGARMRPVLSCLRNVSSSSSSSSSGANAAAAAASGEEEDDEGEDPLTVDFA